MDRMDIKRIPWVTGFLLDMGLEDCGGRFWSSPDGSRSLYLGREAVVLMTRPARGGREFESTHPYPPHVDERWLMDTIWDHRAQLEDHEAPDDPSVN